MEGSQTPQSQTPPQRSRLASPSNAGDREWEAATARAAEEEDRQAELNRQVHEAREAERARWNDTDAALVASQHRYASDIARMPTPDALEAMGSVVGDATQGPAS